MSRITPVEGRGIVRTPAELAAQIASGERHIIPEPDAMIREEVGRLVGEALDRFAALMVPGAQYPTAAQAQRAIRGLPEPPPAVRCDRQQCGHFDDQHAADGSGTCTGFNCHCRAFVAP